MAAHPLGVPLVGHTPTGTAEEQDLYYYRQGKRRRDREGERLSRGERNIISGSDDLSAQGTGSLPKEAIGQGEMSKQIT